MTLINFLPFLVYLIWLTWNTKRISRLVALSNFIISLYALSMFSFWVCSIFDENYYYSVSAFLMITVPLFIIIEPLVRFERRVQPGCKISVPNKRRHIVFSWFLIILGTHSFIFFALNLNKVFNSDLAALRQQIVTEGAFYSSTVYSKTAVFGAYLSPLAILLFFFTRMTDRNRRRSWLLFITSLSFVLYTLNVAGRDGIVIWVISYSALLALFYPFLDAQTKRLQGIAFVGGGAVTVPIFLLISIQRFGGGGALNADVVLSIFDYLGQQLYELSSRLDKLTGTQYHGDPRTIIPVLVGLWDALLGQASASLNRYDLRIESMASGLDTYRFTYFVGDIITETGLIGLTAFTVLTAWILRMSLVLRARVISLPRLILAFSWSMVVIVGVFYFYYGQAVGNVYLIFPFMILIYYNFQFPTRGTTKADNEASGSCPDISVCMATYDGERFLDDQLASILCQMGANDELVISDNGSTDRTLVILDRLADPRVRIFHFHEARGPIPNFANAMAKAVKPVIVLVDQDDVWMPNRLDLIRRNFAGAEERILCLVTEGERMNAEGGLVAPSNLEVLGFRQGFIRNVIKNSYMGCCMAFSRELLDFVMPIPGCVPMHDSWIGILAEHFGTVRSIREPSYRYRVHESNLSHRKTTWQTKVRHRFYLIAALIGRIIFIRLGLGSNTRGKVE